MLSSGFLKFVVHNVADLNMLLMHNRCAPRADQRMRASPRACHCRRETWRLRRAEALTRDTVPHARVRQEILRGGGTQRVHAEAQGDC